MTTNWQTFWKDLSRSYERPARKRGYDFLWMVPQTPLENLLFRQQLHRTCRENHDRAKQIRLACKRDFLFWVKTFGWLLEPRRMDGEKRRPFLPWNIQEKALCEMEESLGYEDVLVDKSREMGASWMVLHLFYHRWAFHADMHFGLGSRTEELVDNPDDTDALMQKCDFIYKNQPSYLRPRRRRTHLRMTNQYLGSTIMGYAFTGNFGRGGRKAAILFDEFAFPQNPGDDEKILASTQKATNSRYYVSTLSGPSGSYYQLRESCIHDPPNMRPAKMIVLDWKDVPERRAGMYTSVDGQKIIVDKDYKFPADYPFILDGKLRSIYYDNECRRAKHNRKQIARELDRDPGAAGSGFFDDGELKKYITGTFAPLRRGHVHRDDERLRFVDSDAGPLEIWCPLNERAIAPVGQYAIGIDISAGTATSLTNNSVAHVVNTLTGEQVAEYVTNREKPEAFARSVYALCQMFHQPFVNFENNGGYATNFKRELMDELRYSNVRLMVNKDEKSHKKTRKPGWFNGKGGLETLFSPWLVALAEGKHIIRSTHVIKEARCYIYKGGKVVYHEPDSDPDGADEGLAHGDRVVAAALAYMAMQERPANKDDVEIMRPNGDAHAPRDTMAWRMYAFTAAQAQKDWLDED